MRCYCHLSIIIITSFLLLNIPLIVCSEFARDKLRGGGPLTTLVGGWGFGIIRPCEEEDEEGEEAEEEEGEEKGEETAIVDDTVCARCFVTGGREGLLLLLLLLLLTLTLTLMLFVLVVREAGIRGGGRRCCCCCGGAFVVCVSVGVYA